MEERWWFTDIRDSPANVRLPINGTCWGYLRLIDNVLLLLHSSKWHVEEQGRFKAKITIMIITVIELKTDSIQIVDQKKEKEKALEC